jgi:two-component system, NtrC family, sensor kinase
VFGTLISSAVELCGADGGTICVRDGEVFRFRANAGASQTEALTKYLEEHPATPGPGSTAGRVLLSGKVEAIPDCLEDSDYAIPMDSLSQSVRSILGVPLLGKEGIEGALVLTRKEPGHFTSRSSRPSPTRLLSRSRTCACSTRSRRARESSPPRSTICVRRRTG